MNQLSGGCLCQKVQYKIISKPLSQGICYCQQCQKSGGAYGSPLLVLFKTQFECTTENLSFCITQSARGSAVTRHFCKDCGSHIFSQISDVPDILTVKAVTLDEFQNFVPQYLVWTQSATPSCALPHNVPAFSQAAPIELVLGYFGL
jgi:hypothetical protein